MTSTQQQFAYKDMHWRVMSQTFHCRKARSSSVCETALFMEPAECPRAHKIYSSKNKHQKLICASLQQRHSELKHNMASRMEGKTNLLHISGFHPYTSIQFQHTHFKQYLKNLRRLRPEIRAEETQLLAVVVHKKIT